MAELNSPHDVFISYSSEGNDKVIADAVCAKLENEKIRCWIAPRDIIPGKHWGGSIVDAISKSSIFVLVFSNNSNESPQVLREVERAVSKGLPILPFRIEDVTPSSDLEYYLSSTHWLDALTPPIEEHIFELAKTIKILMGSQGVRAEKSYDKNSSTDSSQKAPGMAGQRTEVQPLTAQNPELSPDENVEEYDLYDIDIDLMTWSERETKSKGKKLLYLRILSILMTAAMMAMIAIMIKYGSCDAGVDPGVVADQHNPPCYDEDANAGMAMLGAIILSIASIFVAFSLGKKLELSSSSRTAYAVTSFFFLTLPLCILAFTKYIPRGIMNEYQQLELTHRRASGISSQKGLADVLARRAFLSLSIGRQRDAYVFAEEAFTIAKKYQMVNLEEQLKNLLDKIK